jgi:asparagine N-glycosylation enzyme membrane subunit Stt3
MDSETKPIKKPIYKRWWFIVLAIIMLLIIISAATGDDSGNTGNNTQSEYKQNEKEEAVSYIEVSDKAILDAYKNNEIAADQTYKGKAVKVTGQVNSIEKSFGTAYITMNGGDQYAIQSVQCMFAKENEASLANLSKGQTVTVTGIVEGKSLNITIKDCELQ